MYYVSFEFVNYENGDRFKVNENIFDYNNAAVYAEKVSNCKDVVGDVCVCDSMTGEVLLTYEGGFETYEA